MIAVLGCGLLAGCDATVSTGDGNADRAKPANTAPAKEEAKTAVLKDEKRPEGKAKVVKEAEVPEDWVYVYDENKGYGFSVPAGTTGETQNLDGVDVFSATTPSGVDMFVLAYNDKRQTKEDLLEFAVSFLEGAGQKVTLGDLKGESGEYAVGDATTVLEDGRKGRLRILLGTDVSDNYVVIVGMEDDKFAANEKIIDGIWGSFEMWSGGN